jgi:ABC-type transport system involved in multi-copper enzyme maturation permease subunit
MPLWIEILLEVGGGLLAAGAVLLLVYALLAWIAPRTAAIARAATKETLRLTLFWVELLLGSFLLLLFSVVPYVTFGDDLKVMKDYLQFITAAAILLAVWSASVSIAEELEGRTALTLLSKPVSRRQFILGKFLGVLAPVYVLLAALGAVLVLCVVFRLSYDTYESTRKAVSIEQCRYEMLQLLPGLFLAFLQTMVLAAIAVALSTRLSMVPNLLVLTTIYAVGHLAPLFVQSSIGQLPIVTFIGQFLATVLPVLDYFDTTAATAAGHDVPLEYLAWASGYALLYSAIAILFALILFEDRDLA